MIKIIQRRKIWFAFSLILTVLSIGAIAAWGLKLGIDYTGGTLMEVGFNETKLGNQEIQDALAPLNLGEITIQASGEKTAFLRFKDVDENTHQAILTALETKAAAPAGDGTAAAPDTASQPAEIQAQNANGEAVAVNAETAPTEATGSKYVYQKSFESTGPIVGNELKTSTIWALLLAMAGIVLYIGWAFRKVSYPVSSYKYGICATIALLHDVIITVGIFAVLGHFFGIEVGVTFLAALLTILGYSVNDTIVVFDRTRENLLRGRLTDFEEIVNHSVNETFVRSINTSFTTLLMLFALYIFGGPSIGVFVLALLIGITFGTYSSIFIASPLLVTWQQYDIRKKAKK